MTTEVTEIISEQKTVWADTRCDKCGTLLDINLNIEQYKQYKAHGTTRICRYIEITKMHNEWGNDSVDSIEEEVLCVKCFRDNIKETVTSYVNEHDRSGQVTIRAECGRIPSNYDREKELREIQSKEDSEHQERLEQIHAAISSITKDEEDMLYNMFCRR